MGIRLERLHDSLAFDPRPALLMLSGAVGLLFLIVCANIANLQLGRADRPRELAIRRALGAGRRRLVRQLLTESLVISVLGGLGGLAIAAAGYARWQLRGVGDPDIRRGHLRYHCGSDGDRPRTRRTDCLWHRSGPLGPPASHS